jgi:hypothetical protein
MRVAILLALSFCACAAAAEPLRVPRVGGGLIEAAVEPASRGRAAPVALLVRDGCVAALQPFTAPAGVAPVELALPCRPGEDVRSGVLDVITVLDSLREAAPWWDRRLYLLGEGARGAAVAAGAAALTPEVKGVVLIGGEATPAEVGAEAPLLLIRTGATRSSRQRPAVFDPARVTYRELSDPAAAFPEASRWLARQAAPRQPEPAAKAPAPSAPRKTAKADARPRPAKAPTIVLAPAVTAPKAAPRPPALRGALPAAPDRRRGKGRPDPR